MSDDSEEKQRKHVRGTIHWAREIETHLAEARRTHLGDVHFRPSSGAATMVGLRPDRPQRGKGGYRSLERLARRFDEEFQKHCVAVAQGRPTPEKRLQSWLLAEAYRNNRQLSPLDPSGQLRFVTDELVLPVESGKIVCDLLALRTTDDRHTPVVIELKTERQLTRLREQVDGYAALVERHSDLFSELYSVILGTAVTLSVPAERWIVWPRRNGGTDPKAAALEADGIRVVGYGHAAEGYEFA